MFWDNSVKPESLFLDKTGNATPPGRWTWAAPLDNVLVIVAS